MKHLKTLPMCLLAITLYGCAGTPQQQCPYGTLDMPECPPADAVEDEIINEIYEIRTWVPPSKLTIDPIKLGNEVQVPINSAQAKIIGPSHDDVMNSLAARIWLINHPQIFFYQTVRLDSAIPGGNENYGKPHAKFIYGNAGGFVGASNFDYRSNLYNNELGFFFQGDEVRDELAEVFEQLKAMSYRWGSPEWLEMRKKVIQSDSSKAGPAGKQRGIYKIVRAPGLEYLM